MESVCGEVGTVTSCLNIAPCWIPQHVHLLKKPSTCWVQMTPLTLSPEKFRQETLFLSKSSLSLSVTTTPPWDCFVPVLPQPLLSQLCTFWLSLSGRRQEILVTRTAAAPFLLSSSNDVGWLWWHEVRNWATVKVRKIGQCLCRCWAGDPAEAICFLPCYTVSLSVPLFIMQSQSILFWKHLTVWSPRNSCSDAFHWSVRQFF